jgi:hypothetical protein
MPRLSHYFLPRLLFAKKQILYLDGANQISPLLLARFARERGVEVAGVVPAVIRQQMGHTSAAMTRLYSGMIPMEQVQAAFSMKNRSSVVQMEKMENGAAAQVAEDYGAAYRNRTDT